MQPRIELGVLLKKFYFGLRCMYQHALDVMVGEKFSEYDAIKAFRIINELAIFPMMDKTDKVIEKLEKMEKTLNDLAVSENESTSEIKQPLAVMKDDWEPFIKIEIDHQNFLAYCDLVPLLQSCQKWCMILLLIRI